MAACTRTSDSCVESAGRLVEEKNGGIAQHGARKGNALAFAAGQAIAALADLRCIAVRQPRNEVVSSGGLGGFHHGLLRCGLEP
jgi:hypothetical protein